jgi:hypothetical protein
MREPVDTELYNRVRESAKRKFGQKTGLYRSSWMVHEYVKRGGTYRGKRDPHHGLISAFAKINARSKRMKSRRSRRSRRK